MKPPAGCRTSLAPERDQHRGKKLEVVGLEREPGSLTVKKRASKAPLRPRNETAFDVKGLQFRRDLGLRLMLELE
jgi:hypothetical protein